MLRCFAVVRNVLADVGKVRNHSFPQSIFGCNARLLRLLSLAAQLNVGFGIVGRSRQRPETPKRGNSHFVIDQALTLK
jgi:hypothetical protein